MAIATPLQVATCQRFLDIARAEIGVREVPGEGDNARIQEYQRTTTKSPLYIRDKIAWCSSFANWVTLQAGIKGSGSAAARSWLRWGEACDVPIPGCLPVYSRPPLPGSGHVHFFAELLGDLVRGVGGNQGNQVKPAGYPKRRLLGYRMPTMAQIEASKAL